MDTSQVVPRADLFASVNSGMDERTPLIGHRHGASDELIENVGSVTVRPNVILYHRRWYVLVLFALLALLQGLIWNTWGPIAASAKVVFAWQDSDIALQANWGTIVYLISALFFAWLLDVKGIRIASLLVVGLLFVATGIRCFTLENGIANWLINIASILNGLGGPVTMATPPLLSATWFPVNQRTRATAFVLGLNGFGVAISFISGPFFVHLPANRTGVDTLGEVDGNYMRNLSNASTYTKEQIADLRHGIMTYMYAQFGCVAVVALAMLLYFPAKPPTPPSVSAGIERVQFVKGIKDLVRSKGFWVLGGACGLSTGIYNVWTAVMDVNLNPLGIAENTAGFIAFTGVTAGNTCAVIISVFADVFAGRMKPFLITLYSIGGAAFLLFALECGQFIPVHLEIFYVLIVIGSISIAGSAPLLYELTCEETYPVAEGVTSMGITLINNFCGLLFLMMFFIPMENKMWMNWVLFASVIVCLPVFAAYRPSYSRLELDKHHDS